MKYAHTESSDCAVVRGALLSDHRFRVRLGVSVGYDDLLRYIYVAFHFRTVVIAPCISSQHDTYVPHIVLARKPYFGPQESAITNELVS